MQRLILGLTLTLALGTAAVHAASTDAFNKAVAEAYAGYRAAASYLRTGNAGLASLELASALESWGNVVVANSDSPPPPYADDPKFVSTLTDIEKTLEIAMAKAEDGDSESALDTLEPVRGAIYDLRKRNGVRLYADCITELNRAMEPLYKHRRDPPNLSFPTVREQVAAESRTYENLLKDCRSMAPAAYEKDPEFQRLFDGTLESVQSMYPAIESQEPERVVNVLRELRSFDRIIYFRFGS
mgnify:CR=1 FL=1